MKRIPCLLVLLSALAVSGCAVTYTLPDKAVPVDAAGLPASRIPLKMAVVLPDENYTLTKTWINPAAESNSITLTVPLGKLMKRAAQDILPAFFQQTAITSGGSAAPGSDMIYAPTIKDLSFEIGGHGAFGQALTVRLQLTNKVTDAGGQPVFSDETATETRRVHPMSFSESGYLDIQAGVMAAAVNEALLKAARGLAESGEIQAFANGRSGGSAGAVQPSAVSPAGSASQPPADLQALRVKLKDAFEKGAISAEQLGRALDEGGRSTRSKILEAFLEDKIDARKFGELY